MSASFCLDSSVNNVVFNVLLVLLDVEHDVGVALFKPILMFFVIRVVKCLVEFLSVEVLIFPLMDAEHSLCV